MSKRNREPVSDTMLPGHSDAMAKFASEPSANGDGDEPVKPTETKADKFVRLAKQRVPNALKRLSHVENLASRQSYEYTPAQAQKIIDALLRAIQRIRDGFAGAQAKTTDFSLDD